MELTDRDYTYSIVPTVARNWQVVIHCTYWEEEGGEAVRRETLTPMEWGNFADPEEASRWGQQRCAELNGREPNTVGE